MEGDPRAFIFEVCASGQADPLPPVSGWMGLVASERGLRFLGLPAPTREMALQCVTEHYPGVCIVSEDACLCAVAEQVQGYLAGRVREFSVELDLRGHTPFEIAVWSATARIPYGETRTYAWVAAQVGASPGTAQAVGAALASNPVPLIIPCHRVVGSDGSLHGFRGGLEMKGRLLAMERGQATLGLGADG